MAKPSAASPEVESVGNNSTPENLGGNSTPEIFDWKYAGGGAGNSNQVVQASMLAWKFGKPAGQGCIMVNPAAIKEALLMKVAGNGSVENYARPNGDPRFQIPAIKALRKETVLVPGVTMGANVRAFVIPFTKTGCADDVQNLLANPNIKAMLYKWVPVGGDSKNGSYTCKEIQLGAEYDAIYKAIQWPTAIEMYSKIPEVTFERMIVEDYSYTVLAATA